MSEYEKEASGGYDAPPPPAGNTGPPVCAATWTLAIEADNPSLGTVADLIRMFPGNEGTVTMDIEGGPNICTDATLDQAIAFPDPCSWLGPTQINVEVTNEFGAVRIVFFILVQDNMGFCP